jgi:hypothetical protein
MLAKCLYCNSLVDIYKENETDEGVKYTRECKKWKNTFVYIVDIIIAVSLLWGRHCC